MPKNKFYRSGVSSSGFRNGCTTAKLLSNQTQKNIAVIKNTYKLTQLSLSKIRTDMMIWFPKICAENNCKGKITVETKWWWVNDDYTITIEGRPKDVKNIENLLNTKHYYE